MKYIIVTLFLVGFSLTAMNGQNLNFAKTKVVESTSSMKTIEFNEPIKLVSQGATNTSGRKSQVVSLNTPKIGPVDKLQIINKDEIISRKSSLGVIQDQGGRRGKNAIGGN